jgi:nickel transport protein
MSIFPQLAFILRFSLVLDSYILLILPLVWGGLAPQLVRAHGAKITYAQSSALTIQAKYDDGKPIAEAAVVIYAPRNPDTPWLKGKTDREGKFTFTPDNSQEGTWQVKVRQVGHGDTINIPVGKSIVAAQISTNSDYTPLQKLLMTAAVIWGFIGTALFFSRKKGLD